MQRRRGFYAALEAFPEASSIAIGAANGIDSEILAEVARRKSGESDWTGVFCANDMVAFRLMSALEAAGIDVPADVSVIGFDDLPYAALMHPRLTTMRVDCAEMARQAIVLVQRRLAEPDAVPLQVECGVSLEFGGTVAQFA